MSIRSFFKKINCRDTRILPKFPILTKVIFIVLVVFTTTFLIKNSFAATNIIKQTQDAQNKGNNSESWQLNSWNSNSINVLTSLTGEIPFNPDGTIDTTKFEVSGLLGTSKNMIAALYNSQASGIQYIAQVKDNFLGKPSYAQGVGFRETASLQPLLPIWKALRNIVYALFSLVFIIIGIMIMLRIKISPQAVITIQNAIPKLITSLVLVTFSYAIAGLVIDISYWFQAFVLSLLFSAKGVDLGANFLKWNWNTTIPIPDSTQFNFNGLANAGFVKFSMLANRTVPALSLLLLGGVLGQVVIGSLLGGIGGLFGSAAGGGFNLVGGAIGWVVGAVGGIIFMIVLFVLVAIWLIKLFFGLLKTYVTILIQIITAPLVIGMGAFPNSKIGFGSWLIDLISKVAVFPIVLIALVFINYLVEVTNSFNIWSPSLLDAGVAHGSQGILGAAVGLAGLAMLSKLPDLVPAAIFQLKPSPFGQAIGENLKAPGSAIKFGARGGAQGAADIIEKKFNSSDAPGKGLRFLNTLRKTSATTGIVKDH